MMIVKTNSGSTYAFTTKDGEIYMLHGTQEYIVDKLELGVGLPLNIRCHKLNSMNCNKDSEPMVFTSTPITEITI